MEVWQIITRGILVGCSLAILIGPILFLYINTALQEGRKGGVAVVTGVNVSDIFFVGFVVFGLSYIQGFLSNEKNKLWMAIIGGCTLIVLGCINVWMATRQKRNETENSVHGNLWTLFLHGFVVNTFNPFTVVFWVALSTGSAALLHGAAWKMWAFFTSLILTNFILDLCKVFLARRLIRLLTPALLTRIRQIAGIIMCIAGGVLIYNTWCTWFYHPH